jgi:hypothetical protein
MLKKRKIKKKRKQVLKSKKKNMRLRFLKLMEKDNLLSFLKIWGNGGIIFLEQIIMKSLHVNFFLSHGIS